jgi:large subunit ribosomal protein L1
VELTKKASYSKYDGTFEVHLSTNVKNIRGLVSLPYASGKKVKIIAFGKEADQSGADLVGDEAALAEIAKGKIGFDVLITTPEWMPKMAGLAKILGPRGLMPNPKNGTIGADLKKMVDEIQSGKLEYKTESNGKVMHLSLGKVSQPTEELSQNVKVLITTIGKSKIRRATLAPTLGPGVKLDLPSI